MRLGGPVEEFDSPEAWVELHKQKGYRAAYCPVGIDAGDDTIQSYKDAAADADILIAEVGAWCNPISPNADIRSHALDHCKAQLMLADQIGARCCVNIAGSRAHIQRVGRTASGQPDRCDL